MSHHSKQHRRKKSLGVVRVHLSTTREYFYNTTTVPDSLFAYILFNSVGFLVTILELLEHIIIYLSFYLIIFYYRL